MIDKNAPLENYAGGALSLSIRVEEFYQKAIAKDFLQGLLSDLGSAVHMMNPNDAKTQVVDLRINPSRAFLEELVYKSAELFPYYVRLFIASKDMGPKSVSTFFLTWTPEDGILIYDPVTKLTSSEWPED